MLKTLNYDKNFPETLESQHSIIIHKFSFS